MGEKSVAMLHGTRWELNNISQHKITIFVAYLQSSYGKPPDMRRSCYGTCIPTCVISSKMWYIRVEEPEGYAVPKVLITGV